MCLAIREMLVRRVLNVLLMQRDRNIVIDSERGYDPDNRTFYNLADLDDAVKYALEFDEVHIFLNDPKEHSREEGFGPWVYLIYGNGNCDLDIVSDYSTSLEPILKEPVLKLCEGLNDGTIRLTAPAAPIIQLT